MRRTHTYRVATSTAIMTETDNYRLAKVYMKELGMESPQIASELRLERGTTDDDGYTSYSVYEYLVLPRAKSGDSQPLF